ncbi:MAG: hypothetical protein ABUL44_03580, partial [Flavobacterium sp.]
RAWVHIDPTIISDSLNTTSYNLGIDCHSFDMQYLRHSLLLQYNKKPKLIIQSVDIFTLEKRTDLYNSDQFLPYILFNKKIKDVTHGYEGYSHWDYEIPLVRYYGKTNAIKAALKMFLFPANNPVMRIKGYQGQDKAWNNDFDEAKRKIGSYKVKVDTGLKYLFEKYLEESERDHLNIIFVNSPEYIEGQKFVSNRDSIIRLYKSYSKKYKIPFYDFSTDSISTQKRLFYNAMHLNKKGSVLFTNKLVEILKSNKLLK